MKFEFYETLLSHFNFDLDWTVAMTILHVTTHTHLWLHVRAHPFCARTCRAKVLLWTPGQVVFFKSCVPEWKYVAPDSFCCAHVLATVL